MYKITRKYFLIPFLSFVAVLGANAQSPNFAEIQKIVASDRGASDVFGNSVSISGNYAVIGASLEDEDANGLNTLSGAGASYIYEKNSCGVWVEVQKLVASDRGPGDWFGYSVSISGNHVIIGANYEGEDTNGLNTLGDAGSSYVFERNTSGIWIEVQKLVASDRGPGDWFGSSVSISGNYAIIGANNEDEDANGLNFLSSSGSSYIYERNTSGVWIQVQKLVASDRGISDWFGSSVSISGNYAIIAARGESEDANGLNTLVQSGSAYVFERNTSGVWVEVQKIVASDRVGYVRFGSSVSISGNYAIIGSLEEDYDENGLNGLGDAGAAYIFERNTSGIWVEVQKLVASDRGASDNFGNSVSISGNYAIIGAELDDENTYGLNSLDSAGSFYIFERNTSGVWIEEQKLVASDRGTGDYFGNSVSISGNYAIIGANSEDEDANGLNSLSRAGSSYIFELSVPSPSYTTFNITICDSLTTSTGKVFRTSGTFYDTLTAANGCDSILIYNLNINYSSITEIQKIVASDRGSNDRFGYSVSVSGDYVIIGAYQEDEDANGVNTLSSAGSAYIYEKNSSGVWVEVQKLVASDRGSNDRFGYSVSISGNYAIIGAYFEDEDANGLNTLSGSGSSYIFERNSSGVWVQVQKLVASDRGASDYFGYSVSVSGNHAVIGAYLEDEDTNGLNSLSSAGSSYVFERNISGVWVQVQKLVASDRGASDRFGNSVSISGNHAIIGAYFEDEDVNGLNALSRSGSSYVFERNTSGVWVQVQKLVASDRGVSDYFGFSVSISGNYAIIGAYQEDEDANGMNTLSVSGSSYVYEKNSSGVWVQVQKLVASDRAISDYFGYSVSISGNHAIIGAYFEDEDTNGTNTLSGSGSSYVFKRNSSGAWVEIQKLVASDRAVSDYFGFSVSISGNSGVIGALFEDHDTSGLNALSSSGSSYIFEFAVTPSMDSIKDTVCGSYITLSGKIFDTTGIYYDTIAGVLTCDSVVKYDIVIRNSPDTAFNITICDSLVSPTGKVWRVPGTFYDTLTSANGCDSILIYNLTINYTSIAEIQKIVASDRGPNDRFGNSVSISGNYAVIGAYEEDEDTTGMNTLSLAGSAYVYELNSSGVWAEVQKLVASDRGANDLFGHSVSISDNYLVVGAYLEREDTSGINTLLSAGSAYVFERNISGVWTEVQKLVASDRGFADNFGYSVSISGNYLVVGAHQEDEDVSGANTLSASGSAYVFERNISGVWTEVQKLVASDRDFADNFGYSVSISGSYLVVGASFEDHDTSGMNPFPSAGSAYVFERNTSGVWSEVDKLVASDRGATDFFGYSISISGNYLVVGAYFEDHDTSGVNRLFNPGSGYVFERNSIGKWAEVQKLVASDRSAFDLFGNSVSISGNYLVVGAYGEDEDISGANTLSTAGSAYVFERNTSGAWVEFQKIVPSDRASSDAFGHSVSISGNQVIVGAFSEDDDASGLNPLANAGSAYVFEFEVNPSIDSVKDSLCGSYTTLTGRTFTSTGIYYDTLANVDGCDSIIRYDLLVNYATDTIITDTVCDSLVSPSGKIWTSSGIYLDTIINTSGCDSLMTFNLTVNQTTDTSFSVSVCDSLESPSGKIWNTSGNYLDTIPNTSGCDSLFTINLTILPTVNSIDTQTACDSLVWINGVTYYASTTIPKDTLATTNGCDSIVSLNLTINNSSSASDVQFACDSLVWMNGVTYYASTNIPQDTILNTAGCDSIITLDLTINNSVQTTDVQTVCDSLVWINGVTYYASTTIPKDTLATTNGCDSIVSLDLTINNSSSATDVQVACDSLTWINGVTYYASTTIPKDTLATTNGCDSIVTLNLTINNSSSATDVQVACDSLTWINGVTYYSSTNTPQDTILNAAGCDSIITLDLTINNSVQTTDVQTVCDSLVWINGVTYYASTTIPKDTLATTNGCDSIVSLDLTINNSSSATDVQVACDSLVWINGVTYYASTTIPKDTLATTNGCDSIVSLDLTINNSSSATDVQVSCDSLTWINGVTYYASTTIPRDTLATTNGCDSIVSLDLTINNSVQTTDVQTVCDSLTWINGVTYYASTTIPRDTLATTNGCDSIVSLDLTINNSVQTTDVQTVCDSLTWINGVTYYASTTIPRDTLTTTNGCDSIVSLDLTINNSSSATDVQVSCDSLTWINGVTYYASTTIPRDTLTTTNGCDSIVTLDLTINNSSSATDVQVSCDSLTWINGVTYYASTTIPRDTLATTNGCDSIVSLDLTINNSVQTTDVQTVCDSLTWINGVTYYASTTIPRDTLTTTNGCDSIVSLDLTINSSSSATDVQVACDSLTWINGVTYYSSTNTPQDTILNAAGCDSIITLDLTINNSVQTTDVQTICDSLTWINGVTYYASTTIPRDTLTTTNGCDSIVSLDLTINNSVQTTDVQTICDSLTWINGVTYYSSTTIPRDTLTTTNGCDSIVSLDLTINNSVQTTDVQTICDSLTWINGVTYYASTTIPRDTLTTTNGCDSIVSLDLTINNSVQTTDVQTICDSLTWINGVTYYSSTTIPRDTLATTNGCDSIITLDLTINNSVQTTDVQTICDSLTWINGVTYYASTTIPRDTLATTNGCDSIVSLDLTINNSVQTTDVQTVCDSLTWINGVTYYASTTIPRDTLATTNGCDSIVSLDLTINNSVQTTDVQTVCDSLTWINGVTYYASTTIPRDTLATTNGCDSIVTLDLTISTTVRITQAFTECDSLIWRNGTTYYTSNNTAEDTVFVSGGCDTIFTLDLTINNSVQTTDVQTICDSLTWINGVTYYASTTIPKDTLATTNGCDSIVTLNLTINNSSSATDVQTVCDSLTWINGVTYYASTTIPKDTLATSNGCDSIVTLDLTINNSSSATDVQVVCDSLTWINGVTYYASTTIPRDTILNAAGCDSIVTLDLTINNSSSATDVQVVCDSLTWINGVTYYASTTIPRDTLTTTNGCDSIVSLDLTINNSVQTTDVQTICDSLTWINGVTYYASTTIPRDTLTTTNGCDSIVTLDLTISTTVRITQAFTECDSLIWRNGTTYYTSNNTAEDTVFVSGGCDTIFTLDLTINNSVQTTDVQTVCDSLTWINGVTYYASTTIPRDTILNAAGCDSIVTLDLTISTTVRITQVFTECDSLIWRNGTTYYTSNNTATDTIVVASGCDTIFTLDLTINNSSSATDVQVACDSLVWINGVTYYASTTIPRDTLATTNGCDSIVSLDLTINNSSSATDVQTVCDSLTWINGVTYYASTTIPRDTLTTTNGCDSIVSLDLTINNSVQTTDVQTICDSLTWINGVTYYASTTIPRDTLTTTNGCDSIVTLDLTISTTVRITQAFTECDSLIWRNGTTYYTSNNTAEDTVFVSGGCDTIFTLDLTINNSVQTTDVQTVCDSLTWINGVTYYASTTIPRDTILNAAGCDSIVTLDLTISTTVRITQAFTECDSLIWRNGTTYYTSNNTATDTIVVASGCDTIFTLDLTINNSSSATDVQVACDSLVWINGVTYYASTTIPRDTLTTTNGCDSIVSLDLTINNSSSATDVQVACDSLTWINGVTYYASTTIPRDTLATTNGCDSIVSLDLTINNSVQTTDVQTVCDSLTWINGVTYYASTTIPKDTLATSNGCDSIVTLDLTINNSSSATDVQVVCDSLTWINGVTYYASTTIPRDTLATTNGCDSIVTLDLTISTTVRITQAFTECDSLIWRNGTTYYTSNNTATDTIVVASGCDTIFTLDLTINNSSSATDVQVACDSLVWINGVTYYASTTIPRDTLATTNGCDSIVSLDLTINNSSSATDVQVACDSLTWINGVTYYASTTIPRDTLATTNGCDSIVSLDLTINNSVQTTDVQTVCDSLTWINGVTYYASTTIPRDTLATTNGCDSIVSLDLTINNSVQTTDVQTVCDSLTWINGVTYYASTTIPRDTLATTNGCDSIVTLDLTISTTVRITQAFTECDSLIWRNGTTYYTSNNTAEDTVFVSGGCDTIFTLDLTINNSVQTTDVQTICDSLTWINGVTYYASTTIPKDTLATTNGCDSIVTLNLTINNSSSATDVQTVCDSLTWINGVTYYASTTIPKDTLATSNGCDSIVTLDLTINNSSSATDVQVVCDSLTWINGVTYYASTTIPRDTILNAAGCDSIVTLDLTISTTVRITLVFTECDSLIWRNGTTYYTSNNTATDTIVVASGCDTIFTLDLTINNSSSATDVQVACDSLVWINGVTYYASTTIPRDTLATTNGCDSIVSLDLTINNSSSATDVQVACDSLTWINGVTYYASTTIPRDTILNAAGCDSIVTLDLTISTTVRITQAFTECDSLIWRNGTTYYTSNNTAEDTVFVSGGCDTIFTLDLTINNSVQTTDVQTVCDSLTWINGVTYYASTTIPRDTILNAAGCDSIVTLDLTISTTVRITQAFTECDSLIWRNGTTYYTSNNTATDTIVVASGCDTIFTLDLTINNSSSATDVQVACDSLVWINGVTYYASTTIPRDTLATTNGCDSIVSLDLTINNSSSATDVQVACDSLTWINGVTYYASTTIPRDTLTTTNGCDSIVSLDLTINNSVQTTDVQTVCDSLTWINGVTYYASTTIPRDTLTTTNGCDSIVSLDLTINNSVQTTDVQTICDSLTWINGVTYYASTTIPRDTLATTNGCDSIVSLDLTISTAVRITQAFTECDSLIWRNGTTYYTSNNTATDTIVVASGCDTIFTLDLTINNSSSATDVQVACDSLTWINGVTYYASTTIPRDTLATTNGCDSIVSLDLTINNSSSATDVQVACDSLVWINGVTYYASTTIPRDTLTTTNGCDSIVSLDLTISNSVQTTDVQTICDSLTWINGVTYYSSTTIPKDTLATTNGCDSIVTLNLTINNSSSATDVQTVCDSLTWINGVTYYASTTIPKDTLATSNGCDSIVSLDLTISTTVRITQVFTECDSLIWRNGTTYYTSNNTATDTIVVASGCDTIFTLDLTINNSSSATDVQVACDSLTWINGVTYYASTNIPQDTILNAAGCDSIITLDLTINNSSNQSQILDLCAGQTVTVGANTYGTAGTYRDTLTSLFGCDSIIETTLTINPLILGTITSSQDFCSNDMPVSFTATPTGGRWFGPGIDSISGLFSPAISGAGTHTIVYIPNGLCPIPDTVSVQVFSTPTINFDSEDEICDQSNGKIDINIVGGTPTFNFLWSNGSTIQNLDKLKEGTYTVTVSDANNCTDNESISIINTINPDCDFNIFVPNIFSPDGNGENDILHVMGSGIETLKFIVYNRFGNKVFESSSQNYGWDGTFKGSPANVGVFVYYVEGSFVNGEEFEEKGTVTLIRRK